MKIYCSSAEQAPRLTNQQIGKRANLNLLLRLISDQESVSRAQLAKITGLTRATVSALVDELIGRGYVTETGVGQSVTGRKPIMLEINPRGAQFPVITLSRKGMRYVLFDLKANKIEGFFRAYPVDMPKLTETTRQYIEPEVLSETALKLLLQDAQKIDWNRVPALCISIVGSFYWDEDIFSCTPLRIWTKASFVEQISRRIGGIPVCYENATINIGYAVMKKYMTSGSSFTFINIGEGVGACKFNRDDISNLYSKSMLELGHVSVDLNGRPCACGNRGCLERYVSQKAIIGDISDRIRAGEVSALGEMCAGNVDDITLAMIRDANECGDALTRDALRGVARCLSSAIYNMACITETNHVVLGGGIEQLGDGFLEYVQQSMREVGMRSLMKKITLSYYDTDRDDEDRGIMQQYFDEMLPDANSAAGIVCTLQTGA